MCRWGWTSCDNGDLCLGGLVKDCCSYPTIYLYVHEQAEFVVVYDDVCGKQAIECWMQASTQKQEVKEKAGNKPGREAVRYGESTR